LPSHLTERDRRFHFTLVGALLDWWHWLPSHLTERDRSFRFTLVGAMCNVLEPMVLHGTMYLDRETMCAIKHEVVLKIANKSEPCTWVSVVQWISESQIITSIYSRNRETREKESGYICLSRGDLCPISRRKRFCRELLTFAAQELNTDTEIKSWGDVLERIMAVAIVDDAYEDSASVRLFQYCKVRAYTFFCNSNDEAMEGLSQEIDSNRRLDMLLCDLSQAELGEVRGAVKVVGTETNMADETLATYRGETVSRLSMRTLLPDVYISCHVINLYVKLLQERDSRLCQQDVTRGACAFFSTFFIAKLMGHSGTSWTPDTPVCYEGVERWSGKFPLKTLFGYEKLLIPCHNGITGLGGHWGACVVYLQERKIQYYDSLRCPGDDYMKHVKMYLAKEYEKNQPPLAGPSPNEWECIVTQQDTPTQNGCDCGMFTTMFIDFISLGMPVTLLRADQGPRLRNHMLLSVLHQRLHDETVELASS
jgi:hypothetical protein